MFGVGMCGVGTCGVGMYGVGMCGAVYSCSVINVKSEPGDRPSPMTDRSITKLKYVKKDRYLHTVIIQDFIIKKKNKVIGIPRKDIG